MFQLIVFDLDGTLVDSRRDIAESANATLVACGFRRAAAGRRHRRNGRRRRASFWW
jgi:phosphoglycolate phosphatase-like HAD superfamily hydrolase